jgi:hypothetical protein
MGVMSVRPSTPKRLDRFSLPSQTLNAQLCESWQKEGEYGEYEGRRAQREGGEQEAKEMEAMEQKE